MRLWRNSASVLAVSANEHVYDLTQQRAERLQAVKKRATSPIQNPSVMNSAQVSSPVIGLSQVRFAWRERTAAVIDIESLVIEAGERVFLRGASGSGKSTLLGLLAGMTVADTGTVTVLDQDMSRLGGAERDRFRADHIGFIFQMFNLIPYLSVVENVTLPCEFSPRRRVRAERSGGSVAAEAVRLLGDLGMAGPDLLHRRVTDLSVGQQQRVAAARALIGAPELVIADEPTSALDADLRLAFVDLLFRECARAQETLVFVSHDSVLASRFDRAIEFSDINRTVNPNMEAAG